MLPSACLSALPSQGRVEKPSIYEPIHGSAPDIAGQGIANPIGTILSVAMMLEYSAGEVGCARKIETAVEQTLNNGFMTRDLGGSASTTEVTEAIIKEFMQL